MLLDCHSLLLFSESLIYHNFCVSNGDICIEQNKRNGDMTHKCARNLTGLDLSKSQVPWPITLLRSQASLQRVVGLGSCFFSRRMLDLDLYSLMRTAMLAL